jgi:transcriptional regulator with XRE-family HTH domain
VPDPWISDVSDKRNYALPGFGRNLAALINSRDLSPDQVAQRSELAPKLIERFLAEEAEPSVSELLRLAGALGVGTQDLLEGIESGPGSTSRPGGRRGRTGR